MEMESRLVYVSMAFCLMGTQFTAAQESIAEVNNGENVQQPAPGPDQGERVELTRLDPVELGHVYTMELEPGKFYQVKTAAVNPPIFNFLSPAECTSLKSLAESKGLHSSRTVYREHIDHAIESTTDPYYNSDTFNRFDEDNNGYLTMDEARRALDELEGVSPMSDSTFMRFIDAIVDMDSNRELSDVEFRRIPIILTTAAEWVKEHEHSGELSPEELKKLEAGPVRISHQVWMNHEEYDPAETIRNRLITLTGLHPDIVRTSEQLQIVRYLPGGHYHAHHDTTEFKADQPCQHTKDFYPPDPEAHLRTDRICRYMTVLYYLVDTEEGGETAFPAADNGTYSTEAILRENETLDPIDLTHHCKDANLYVIPRRGMAVMWYNHYLDADTGWLGDLNRFSLHGGCDVIKGEKWIANNWINVDSNYDVQMKFHHDRLHKPPTEGADPDLERTAESTGGSIPGSDYPAPAGNEGQREVADEL